MFLLKWLRSAVAPQRPPAVPPEDQEQSPDPSLFPILDQEELAKVHVGSREMRGQVRRLYTGHGAPVYANSDGSLVHRSNEQPPDAIPVYAYNPRNHDDVAFFLAISAGKPLIAMANDGPPAECLSFVVEPGPAKFVRLRHPYKRLYVSAAQFGADHEVELVCDRAEASNWENLRLADTRYDRVVGRAAELAMNLDHLYESGLDADKICIWLRNENPDIVSGLAAAVFRLLPEHVLAAIQNEMDADSNLRDILAGALPADEATAELWTRLADDAGKSEIAPTVAPDTRMAERHMTDPDTPDPDMPNPDMIATSAIYRVFTAHGAPIFATRDGRLVHRSGPPYADAIPVIIFIAAAHPDIAFVIADFTHRATLRMDGDEPAAECLSFLVEPGGPGVVSLQHPIRRRYVSAAWFEPGQEVALASNRPTASGWEMLRLDPMSADLMRDRAAELVAALERVLDKPFDEDTVCAWLCHERPDILAGIAASVLQLLPFPVLTAVARRMLADAAFALIVLDVLPADRWTRDLFPQLAVWCARREPVWKLSITPDFDFLHKPFALQGGISSIGSLLTSLARTTVEPRRGIAMLATARNEGIYFLEWIAHYRGLGVDHFFIYSNDNNDHSDELLSALADNHVITWIRNSFAPGIDGQMKAYAHCMSCVPQSLDFRWTMIADLDEFVILNTSRYADMNDFMQAREEGGAMTVSLSWLMYTISGQMTRLNEPLLERNRYVSGYDDGHVKTLFRTRYFSYAYPHDPLPVAGTSVVYHDAAGALHYWPERDGHPSTGRPQFDDAWVGHYYFKSIDEWTWKLSRNRGGFTINKELTVNTNEIVTQLLFMKHSTDIRDDRAVAHLPALNAELDILRSLPGVREAEAMVQETFVALTGRLRERLIQDLEDRIAHGPTDENRRTATAALAKLTGPVEDPRSPD